MELNERDRLTREVDACQADLEGFAATYLTEDLAVEQSLLIQSFRRSLEALASHTVTEGENR